MKVEDLDVKRFSQICAQLVDCPNGDVFVKWLEARIRQDSYDAINPHNTSRNEGFRAAFRQILEYIERGRDPKSFQEEANT